MYTVMYILNRYKLLPSTYTSTANFFHIYTHVYLCFCSEQVQTSLPQRSSQEGSDELYPYPYPYLPLCISEQIQSPFGLNLKLIANFIHIHNHIYLHFLSEHIQASLPLKKAQAHNVDRLLTTSIYIFICIPLLLFFIYRHLYFYSEQIQTALFNDPLKKAQAHNVYRFLTTSISIFKCRPFCIF